MAHASNLLSGRELAAWRGMLATHSRMVAELDAELERDHGLPLTSYEVLMYLGDADGNKLRMGELADKLLLSRSGITRLADRLERQGLIARERCTDDGRGFNALLTDAGRELLAVARPAHLAGVSAPLPRSALARRDSRSSAGSGAACESNPRTQRWTKRPDNARYAGRHMTVDSTTEGTSAIDRDAGRRADRARDGAGSPSARRSRRSATSAGSR